jgi:hypothetical protein
MPVTANDRNRAGRVAPDEEAVVDRVVRDGRGVEAGVEHEGDLGRLAAGEDQHDENHKKAAHRRCSVGFRPVQ